MSKHWMDKGWGWDQCALAPGPRNRPGTSSPNPLPARQRQRLRQRHHLRLRHRLRPPERIVATADLAAFLTRRLRQLAAPAGESGQPDDAGRWTRTADATQAALPAAL
ncbi:hypothetical protein ABZ960_14370 [Streptomyces pseudovenezuelae]|uniref:hypothetical protein n=1 Tax=Streptomyces pseudovenezuelae TaxID=67350 RepID=UPI0034A18223